MRWSENLLSVFYLLVCGNEARLVDVLSTHGPDLGSTRGFTLRQVHHHGVHKFPELYRYTEVDQNEEVEVTDEFGNTLAAAERRFTVAVQWCSLPKPPYPRLLKQDGSLTYNLRGYIEPTWFTRKQSAPDVTDKQTVLSFAKMAANAYARRDNSSDWKWQDIGSGFNYTDDFGWENDGLRGHVFADERNQTVVISIKGTSVPWVDDPDTTTRDVTNDNLFGSCCCGQGGPYWWKQVCDCKTSAYTCDSNCLTKAIHKNSTYYWAAQEVYDHISSMFPRAQIWLTGHSLGGVVSSLLGLTYGLPTITFEAYPDAMAASRLGLPTPPRYDLGGRAGEFPQIPRVYHFGHTADPIFMGTCNGAFSPCSLWGYAFEGLCHTGKRCVYDTVSDFKWRQDIRRHSIITVIEKVIDVYDSVPVCQEDADCVDCAKWKFLPDQSVASASSSKQHK